MKRWMTENAGLKAISLVLAILLWLFVKGITSDRRIVGDVPLEIKVKPGLALLDADAKTVSVVVSGTREDLRQLSRQDVAAFVDLTRDTRTGQWTVRLRPKMIRAPRRVIVDQVEPAQVTVVVDQMVEREMRVEPQLVGTLPAGFSIERVMMEPQTVRIQGPKSLLETQAVIATLPIDVTGRRTSFRESVELSPQQFAEGQAQRQWVQADVRVTEGRPVDSTRGAGVQGNR